MSGSPQKAMKNRGETILVTGANSLLGQHIIKELNSLLSEVSRIKTWDSTKDGTFLKRIDYSENLPINEGDKFCGYLGEDPIKLAEALSGVSTLIHGLEIQDFAMHPDTEEMRRVNSEDTKALLDACENEGSVKRFILISSIFIHASTTWPSVSNPEITKIPPHEEWPFPEYLRTKCEAERALSESRQYQTFTVRMGPLYGEGDRSSVIAQSLRYADTHGKTVAVIGDRKGVIQHTYAGNAGWGVLKVMEKMRNDPEATKETIFILDDTPVESIYSLLEPIAQARGCHLSERHIPWFPFYGLYLLLEKGLLAAEKVFGSKLDFITHWLPSSNYFFTHFYFWYFFAGTKSQTYLGYRPLYSYRAALEASKSYYSVSKL